MATDRPKVVLITQSRMNSARLPGKALKDICGEPLLQHHLTRLMRCRKVDQLVLATTQLKDDDCLENLAVRLGVPVFRGAEQDVLDRFARCAAVFDADVVVRVTGDCPLIDPDLCDLVIDKFLTSHPPFDYVSLGIGPFPRGLDTEVFSIAALISAFQEARHPGDREHVTPFIHRNVHRFRIGNYNDGPGGCAGMRWCVDEEDDLRLVRRLVETLKPTKPDFHWQDCIDVLSRHPGWTLINSGVRQRSAPTQQPEN